jgi:hypothetical protein
MSTNRLWVKSLHPFSGGLSLAKGAPLGNGRKINRPSGTKLALDKRG